MVQNENFKRFVDNKHRIQEKTVIVLKKRFFLVLPYLGSLSLQTRTKLRKSLIGILICCKLLIMFKSRNKLCNVIRFKDCFPKELASGVVHKFQCGFCSESYHEECIRHLNIRIGSISGCHHGQKRKLMQWRVPLVVSITCYLVTILNFNFDLLSALTPEKIVNTIERES